MISILTGIACMAATLVGVCVMGLICKHYFPNAGFDDWRERHD